jgi:hypothetical protein
MMSRRVILAVLIAAIVPAAALAQTQTPRFYPDDPLRNEPVPLPVPDPQPRALSDILERINNTFKTTGQRHPPNGVIPAGGVNTLGEVMDGDWYVNRHGTRRMTIDELQRGPGNDTPPATGTPWQVLVVKPFGLNPGLLIGDAKNDLYVLRFDPVGYEGLATGAEMVTSRFLYALGYHVPENYLVGFDRSQLVAHAEGQAVSSAGRTRALVANDIDAFLRRVPLTAGRTFRAVATRLPESRQSLLGPYQVWGTRTDDPNDTVLHEHRRDLRGLFVFSAWLNNSSARAVSTQDILRNDGGVRRIRHYLIDFTRSLGSGIQDGPKLAWEGNEPAIPREGTIRRNIASLGISTPAWMKAKYSDLAEVGAFESQTFDPLTWKTVQPLPPFVNRLPDDTFWAAKQVMTFTDEEIRAIVQTGQYSKAAEDWISAALIERRNRIGRVFFSSVLPLDRFRLTGNALEFDDLAVAHGLSAPRLYTTDWYGFDNAKDTLLEKIGSGPALPAGTETLGVGTYVAARVYADDAAMSVTVYLRRRADGFDVIGTDRTWPGKVVAPPMLPAHVDRRIFADLSERQQVLFQTYSDSYNQTRGSRYTPEEGFNRLSVSEQTTFYGITHALTNTRLTDASGASLGVALDRVESVERIAGQYAGRSGDEQFRLYVNLKPDSREVLEKSREFIRDRENTVYHAGYPSSYRQAGKEPTLQFSVAEDGVKADIDVDYRSSKSPASLFNGHLTASNSDIRVGDNSTRHRGRWGSLITWWQDALGRLPESLPEQRDPLDLDRPDAPATPLPPDRPAGSAPERIEDAAQEFLTDWLVRHQYEQALEVMSPRAYACLNLNDSAQGVALDAEAARRELRRLMEYAAGKLGTRTNLTSAILAVTPRDPKRVVVEHPFRREFLLTPLAETEARTYLCGQGAAAATSAQYFGVVFQFRRAGGGTLGLLWTREAGLWKLVSFQPIAQ